MRVSAFDRPLLWFLRSTITLALLSLPGLGAEAGLPLLRISDTTLTLRAEATARRFIAAHGRRGMVVGYAAESLEGWVYPFRIFHNYRVGFRVEGSSDVTPGAALVRDVVVNPESVTRIYSGQSFTVRETVFVPLDAAGFVILYHVESRTALTRPGRSRWTLPPSLSSPQITGLDAERELCLKLSEKQASQ